MRIEETARGVVAASTATLAFSWGFVLVKAIPLAPAAMASWRLAIGSAVLGGVALWWRVPWPRAPLATVAAGLAFGVHQLLFIAATQETSIAIVTLIGALQPVVVAAVSRRLLHEPLPPTLAVAAFAGVAGVGLVVFANQDDPSRSLYGDLLAVVNLFAFTTYFLAARRARHGGGRTLTVTAGFLTVALAVVVPWALLVSPGPVASVPPSGSAVAMLFVLALIPGNGHLLLNWAHPRISAALGSLVLALVPVLASVWAHLVFGEPWGPAHWLGSLLVIAAIEAARRAESRNVYIDEE